MPQGAPIQEILVVLHLGDVEFDPETDDFATHLSSEFFVEAYLERLGKVETMLRNHLETMRLAAVEGQSETARGAWPRSTTCWRDRKR